MPERFIWLATVVFLAAGWSADSSPASQSYGKTTKLTDHILVYHGPINVGVVRDGTKALLIDCGEGSMAAALTPSGITKVEEIWFTHHHRDQACGAYRFAARGTRIRAPESERAHFDNVAAYWRNPENRWYLYNQHPHHLMLAESVRVDATLSGGQTAAWGPAKITVLDTPGHTDGSISFLVEADGKRIVFCGDAIFDAGRVWELWSLQKSTAVSDYVGFLGARPQLKRSLERIKTARPDLLVPSHGKIIVDPSRAIDLLIRRLDLANERYAAIASVRRSAPIMVAEYAGRPNQMPIRPGKQPPDCLRHFGTTWMLISQDKAALVMDCGKKETVDTIREMLAKGEIRGVEGLWITHYHYDHIDGIPAFHEAFPKCPCITDRSVAEVITNPLAWRLPCISPVRVGVDRVAGEGESWQWREFKLTAYHFPGQTFYHSGLFVEGQGLRMLFAGDSFTMAGIADHCMHNRNLLGKGLGFDRCLALVQELKPTHVFHSHVAEAFDFTDQQCRFMRANLAEREILFAELVPWDNPNYGVDEPWARCYPYEQKAAAGKDVVVEVVVTNHSSRPNVLHCRPILPRAWDGKGTDPVWPTEALLGQQIDWPTVDVPAKSDGRVRLSFRIPKEAKPGRYVIPIDMRYGRWALPQFTEAIVEL